MMTLAEPVDMLLILIWTIFFYMNHRQKGEKDRQHQDRMEERDRQLREKDDYIKASSLYTVIVGTYVETITNLGGRDTNMSPVGHMPRSLTLKAYVLRDLIPAIHICTKGTGVDPKLETSVSQLMARILSSGNKDLSY